jgi:hypothetical protein
MLKFIFHDEIIFFLKLLQIDFYIRNLNLKVHVWIALILNVVPLN